MKRSGETPTTCISTSNSREEERKQQGLPPRIGIVPYSTVADEEKRIEEEQEQKKQRPRKHPKPTVSAKRRARRQGHD